jgi:hypothetical protein
MLAIFGGVVAAGANGPVCAFARGDSPASSDAVVLQSTSFLPDPATVKPQGEAAYCVNLQDEFLQLGDVDCANVFAPRVEEFYNKSEPGRRGGMGARFGNVSLHG